MLFIRCSEEEGERIKFEGLGTEGGQKMGEKTPREAEDCWACVHSLHLTVLQWRLISESKGMPLSDL